MAMYMVIFKNSNGMTVTHLTKQKTPHAAVAHAIENHGDIDDISVYTVQPCEL